jgi:aminoglycoside phosphotransferase (APT) family kinase protein
MSPPTDVAAALAPWLAAKLGTERVEVRDVRRHTEGWSWHTYTLEAAWDGQERGFAVRREPEDGLLAPYDIRAQYALHRALLDHADVPVPALHWLELDPSVLGMPFYVMDRVQGDVPVQWQPRDRSIFPDDEARRAVGRQFVDVLARIHAVDPGVTGLPPPAGRPAEHEVARWERFYADAALLEVPLVREALAWLRAHPVASERVVLCHGDYRLGNFMLDARRRIVAVLDWELAHLGDPVEDIAWSALRLFRGRSPRWSQMLEPEEFLARYEARTGLSVDPAALRFWTVLCYVRAIAPHLRACRAFEDGAAGDLRLAAMGHQALYALKQLEEVLPG